MEFKIFFMVESLLFKELEPKLEPVKKNARSRSKMDRLRNSDFLFTFFFLLQKTLHN